jgi:hypothetical protein
MLNLSNVIDNELEIFQHNYHVIHKNTDTILDWFRQQHYHHKELEDFLNMYDTVLDPTRSNIDASIRARDTLMNHLSSGKSGERRKNALINSYNNYIQIHEDLHQYLSSVRQSRIVTITLIEKDSNEDRQLTSQFLVEEVAPFIHAIAEIIRIFNEANSIELIKPIKIVEISQNSPTQFSLMGDLGNLWERIRETFLKEWKTPAIEEKNLKVDELRLAIERNKAETIGLRIQNDVKRQITEQEREIHQLEVEKRQLENIRLQQEIARLENDNWLELFKKALGIIEEHFPNLSEQNKFDYARQLTDPVKIIASSSLQIAPADDTKAE